MSVESNPYEPPEVQIATPTLRGKSGVSYLVIGIGLFLLSIVVQGLLFLYAGPQILKISEELGLEVPLILVVAWDVADFCWEYWLVYCLPLFILWVVSEWRFKEIRKKRVRQFIGITLGIGSVAVTVLMVVGVVIAFWQFRG